MKTKKLAGKALELAAHWRDLTNEMTERKRVIEADANRAWAAVQEQVGAEIDETFAAICKLSGIEDGACWNLIYAFLAEHGEAFLILDEQKFRLLAEQQRRLGANEPQA